jgi:FMN-dependent NADH-azoreductase
MTTPQITIHDAPTGETITRDMNAAELAQLETDLAQAKKDAAAKNYADKKAAQKKQQILDRLGITNEELLAILS